MTKFEFSLVILLLGFASIALATPLDDYINMPDPSYSWTVVSQVKSFKHSVYYVNMTSQTWLSPSDSSRSVWFHWLAICVPDQLAQFDTATLFINGGSNDNFQSQMSLDPLTETLCVSSGLITASLYQVPNQPIVFSADPAQKSRSEDGIIAWTWAHYLNDTSKPYWLARLPMTKAAVRAMDTMQAFAAKMNGFPKINGFAVLGGSKRGWTTWMAAAADPRVRVFIPIVIPVLDLANSLNRLFQPYGQWSFTFQDYIEAGVMPRLNSQQFAMLASIEDPLAYLERYGKRPYYVICSAMDEFFLPDSANGFWDMLTGNKFLRIVPNADHSLAGQQVDVALTADTFINMYLYNEPGPIFDWKMVYSNDTASIVATIPAQQPGTAKLTGVYMWWSQTLSTKQRDYRLLTCMKPECFNPVFWHYEELKDTQGNGVYTVTQNKPTVGWKAFLIEAVFTFTWPGDVLNPSRALRLSTEVNVVPNMMPFPTCEEINKC